MTHYSRCDLCPTLLCLAAISLSALFPERAFSAPTGQLELKVIDSETKQPLAVRMHLKDQKGKSVALPGIPYWHDHFPVDGRIVIKLPPGTYHFELERGPEYRVWTGYFSFKPNDADSREVEMRRFVDMKKEGWWSGDLHIHRDVKDIELLMRAEDLHVAPVITWWKGRSKWTDLKPASTEVVRFDEDRFWQAGAGEDERNGGALLYYHLPQPLGLADAGPEFPSPVKFIREAREHAGVHVDVEKPFWWDVPTWVATGLVDSIGLANNHMCRSSMLDNEAWGKPRDKTFYPGPNGNGRWSQDIYYHLLNCGLRISPSAGSASGVLPNPVGYNRVYVHCDGELTWEKWWDGLRAGRVTVTNGPLLRPTVEDQLPGHVFEAPAGQSLELQIALNLATRDTIEYLEVIQNGTIAHEVRLDKWAEAGGRLPPLTFKESGWFLVRAVTKTPETYRFASSGPYYVQIGDRPRISRASAQFFVDWVYERARNLKLDDPQQQAEVLEFHRAARDYWQKKVDDATAP